MKVFIIVTCFVISVVSKPQGYSYVRPSSGALSVNLLPPTASQFGLSPYNSYPPISSHAAFGLGRLSPGGALTLGKINYISKTIHNNIMIKIHSIKQQQILYAFLQ